MSAIADLYHRESGGSGGGKPILAAILVSYLPQVLTFFGTLILERVLKLFYDRACN
jgi:hypothetical protein